MKGWGPQRSRTCEKGPLVIEQKQTKLTMEKKAHIYSDNCYKLLKSLHLIGCEQICRRNVAVVTDNKFYETGPRYLLGDYPMIIYFAAIKNHNSLRFIYSFIYLLYGCTCLNQ